MEVKRWTKETPIESRCDFTLSNGDLCGNMRVDGATRCPLHGANMQLAKEEHKSMRMYRLAKFQKKVDKFADHGKLKTLHEEVAILRMLVEEKINVCEDMTDLMMVSGPVTEMVMKVQKLVESCDRLEMKSGSLLNKTQIQNIATQLMQAVAAKINEYAEVNDIDVDSVSSLLEAIANEFLSILKGDN
jgi:hypothetical protein